MNGSSRRILRAALLTIVLYLITPCHPCLAQTKVQKIDELMRTYFENGLFNGAVLVSENGKVIYNKCFGIADPETKENIQLDSQFRLASVTKQFTAMAVMILHERGKLNFDDDIKKYLPELPYSGITIRHLLTHTSGLPSYLPMFEVYWDIEHKGTTNRKTPTNKDALNLLVEHHPLVLFRPGERYEYCNTGYMLLALVVERVSGIEYDEFMKANIFAPLGMKNTLVYSLIKNQKMKRRVYGYKMSLDETEYISTDYSYLNAIVGDGGMYSTVEDMFLWDQALYTEKLVSESTLAEAFTRVTLNNGHKSEYGFGWSVIDDEEGKIVAHGGGWCGFRTFILREIEQRNAVILLCNNSKMRRGDIAFKIREILHGRDVALPK